MADETSVDIDELIKAMNLLNVDNASLQSAYHQMLHIMDSTWGSWGDDETGKQFAKNYIPNLQTYLSQLGPAMGQLQDNMGLIGQLYHAIQDQDTDNEVR